jgi:hypothetical protein
MRLSINGTWPGSQNLSGGNWVVIYDRQENLTGLSSSDLLARQAFIRCLAWLRGQFSSFFRAIICGNRTNEHFGHRRI